MQSSRIRFESMWVRTESSDRVGQLVLLDGELAAVLVRLDSPGHLPGEQGRWFLEAGFGECGRGFAPTFADLDEAARWVEVQAGIAPAAHRPQLRVVMGASE